MKGDGMLYNFLWVWGWYWVYEKVYFGDYFGIFYVFDIEGMIIEDLGIYRVVVKDLKSGVWIEKIIELWYEGKNCRKGFVVLL